MELSPTFTDRRCRPGREGGARLLLVLAIATWLVGRTSPAAADPPARLAEPGTEVVRPFAHLLVTSQVGGRFADPTCREGETLTPAPFARYAEALRRAAEEDGAFLIDTGGLLAPHGVARFAAREKPEALADLVVSLGFGALALGEADLGAPRQAMIQAIAALRSRDVPVVATNLVCAPTARAFCGPLVDASDGVSIRKVAGERIAIIGLLPPEALSRISPERASGIQILPPAEVLAKAVRSARRQGATMIIASFDTSALGADAASRVFALAGDLPEDGKPDALLAGGAGDQILFARPRGFRPGIIGAPAGGASRVRVRRNYLVDTFDMLTLPVPPAADPHPAIDRFISRVGPSYCDRWGRELRGARLTREFSASSILELSAGAMREATGTEVAILDPLVLDGAFEANAASISASDVFIALKQDEPVMVAEVDGVWLEQIARRAASGQLVAFGLAVEEDGVKIHGRLVQPRGRYRVSTIRALTLGRAALAPGPEWEALEDASLRSVVLDYLEKPRSVDPRDDFSNFVDRAEWTFRTDVNGSFAGSSVRVPDGSEYPDSQLRRANQTTFGFQGTFRADGEARLWGWLNLAEARYRVTNVAGGQRTEGDDLITYRSTARWRRFYASRPRFYVPEPFVENYLETEFTIPEQADRDFRHFLLRPSVGVQFTLFPQLFLKMSGGFERQVLDPEGVVLPGAGLQLQLRPWTILREGTRKLEVSMNLDYFVSDIFNGDTGLLADGSRDARRPGRRQTLRGDLRASYDLAGPLAIGVSLDVFGVKEPGRGVAVAATTDIFIRVSWLGRTMF